MSNFTKYFLCLMVLLTACNTPEIETISSKAFFDLPSYFEGELDRLKQISSLKKIVIYNNQQEEKELKVAELNFKDELKMFIDSDINRASWLDKYEVDSITNASGQLEKLNYTSVDPTLKTKSLQIQYANNEVNEIRIENQTGSYLSNSRQSLIYQVGRGYSIDSQQELILFSDRVLKVQVAFED